ncbi:MAG: hypothetical protein ACD_4C00193G0002 [uncultured bacterium (gcode 4)]|uniref:Uncharacterized protein n=1 Tax=uncultured bacterium (gcode 4) TaxID=1234023 RepID=K2FXS7_9BACT|nr:MAG: hypothetical protein ACD_4C00193G0002 [uncultured bacterium (gcode 4)]
MSSLKTLLNSKDLLTSREESIVQLKNIVLQDIASEAFIKPETFDLVDKLNLNISELKEILKYINGWIEKKWERYNSRRCKAQKIALDKIIKWLESRIRFFQLPEETKDEVIEIIEDEPKRKWKKWKFHEVIRSKEKLENDQNKNNFKFSVKFESLIKICDKKEIIKYLDRFNEEEKEKAIKILDFLNNLENDSQKEIIAFILDRFNMLMFKNEFLKSELQTIKNKFIKVTELILENISKIDNQLETSKESWLKTDRKLGVKREKLKDIYSIINPIKNRLKVKHANVWDWIKPDYIQNEYEGFMNLICK